MAWGCGLGRRRAAGPGSRSRRLAPWPRRRSPARRPRVDRALGHQRLDAGARQGFRRRRRPAPCRGALPLSQLQDERVARRCRSSLMGRSTRRAAPRPRPGRSRSGSRRGRRRRRPGADLDQHRVLVAVDADLLHQLQLAGGLALLPQRVARAAEVVGDSRVSSVSASASAFIQASISTSPVSAWVAMAAIRPLASKRGASTAPRSRAPWRGRWGRRSWRAYGAEGLVGTPDQRPVLTSATLFLRPRRRTSAAPQSGETRWVTGSPSSAPRATWAVR